MLKIVGVLLVIGIVGLILFISTMLGTVIKYGVEGFAPSFVGAPVTIDSVDISIFSGKGSIKGFTIHNPEGFKTKFAIKLDEAAISIDVGSLLSNTIVINEILIDGPQVTYEGTMDSSNMKTIMGNVEKATASDDDVSGDKSREPTNVKGTASESTDETPTDEAGEETKLIMVRLIFLVSCWVAKLCQCHSQIFIRKILEKIQVVQVRQRFLIKLWEN